MSMGRQRSVGGSRWLPRDDSVVPYKKNGLNSRRAQLNSAFPYGKDILDQSQRTQARDGEEIRRAPGRAQSEEGLRRFGPAPPRRQPDAGGEPLRSHGPPPGVHPPVQSLAADVSRARLAGTDPWRDEVQLVGQPEVDFRVRRARS